jgi:3-hydroxyisobutyrate dehydrogenase
MAEREITAVLGAGGTMGSGIASNLLAAGIAVKAWNRTREKIEALAEDGAELAETAAAAAAGSDIVVTMLSDADAVLEAMRGQEGALAGLAPGAVWLQMSTIGDEGTEACAKLAREHELVLVDAPVLGTKQPAEQGKLVVLASGPKDEVLRERLRAIFDAVGQKTVWVGEAGSGTRLKLVTNSWIVTLVEGAAETIALAEGLGVDPAMFFEAIEGGPLDLPYLQMKGRAMLERDFSPSFRLALAAKDAHLAREAAERTGLDLPLLVAIDERLQQGVPEHGDEDLAATYWMSSPDARAGAPQSRSSSAASA